MGVFQSNVFQNNVFQGPHESAVQISRTVFVLPLPTTGRGLLFRSTFDSPTGGGREVKIPAP
jgi:hypothetical protein